MLGHKTSISKLKKTETIPSIFSNHNSNQLKENWKIHKYMEIKQYAIK